MDEQLKTMFMKVVRAQRSAVQKKLTEYNLYYGQPPILFCIQQHGKITQKELAKKVDTSKEAMSITLKRLLNNGFIKKETDRVDRRLQLISLSNKGEEVVKLCKENFAAVHQKMFKHLSKEQQLECIKLFELMLMGLEKGEK